jgi:WD40 repeat protein
MSSMESQRGKRLTAAIIGFLAAQLALSAPPPKTAAVIAPPPKLLREINLNQIIHERAGVLPSTHSVRAVTFSPDENWVAVAVGRHRREGKFKPADIRFESHLLILPLQESAGHPVQAEPRILLGEGSLAWSPGSDALVVQGMLNGGAQLYNVRGDQLWKRDHPGKQVLLEPWIAGFIDPGHLLAHHVPAKGEPEGFDTLDLQGQVVDTWTAPKQWRGGSINSDRQLLAVFSDFAQSKLLIIDYPSKKVLQINSGATWLYRDGGRSALATAYFAESGKTICTVGSAQSHDTHAQCWDIDSGRKIAEYERFLDGAPAAASAHGSRIVLTQSWVLGNNRTGHETFSGGRVVWDFRSGAEVAAWAPAVQSVETNGNIRDIAEPSSVAISSTGRYIAEGADGILRIYELP